MRCAQISGSDITPAFEPSIHRAIDEYGGKNELAKLADSSDDDEREVKSEGSVGMQEDHRSGGSMQSVQSSCSEVASGIDSQTESSESDFEMEFEDMVMEGVRGETGPVHFLFSGDIVDVEGNHEGKSSNAHDKTDGDTMSGSEVLRERGEGADRDAGQGAAIFPERARLAGEKQRNGEEDGEGVGVNGDELEGEGLSEEKSAKSGEVLCQMREVSRDAAAYDDQAQRHTTNSDEEAEMASPLGAEYATARPSRLKADERLLQEDFRLEWNIASCVEYAPAANLLRGRHSGTVGCVNDAKTQSDMEQSRQADSTVHRSTNFEFMHAAHLVRGGKGGGTSMGKKCVENLLRVMTKGGCLRGVPFCGGFEGVAAGLGSVEAREIQVCSID